MKLEIRTRNRKGGNIKITPNLGFIQIMPVSAENFPCLIIDAFQGFGKTYKEMDVPEVRIYDKNVEIIYRGTLQNLVKLIEDTKSIAEAIRLDLDQNEGITNNDVFDYEQYKQFSEKY